MSKKLCRNFLFQGIFFWLAKIFKSEQLKMKNLLNEKIKENREFLFRIRFRTLQIFWDENFCGHFCAGGAGAVTELLARTGPNIRVPYVYKTYTYYTLWFCLSIYRIAILVGVSIKICICIIHTFVCICLLHEYVHMLYTEINQFLSSVKLKPTLVWKSISWL